MKNSTQRLCAHIKTNGEQCEAIRLSDDHLCYFHSRDRQRQMVIDRYHRQRVSRLNAGLPANECFKQNDLTNDIYNESAVALLDALELPMLEDANAIQVTATNVLRLIAYQQMDLKSAWLMLYGLQIVSGILGKMNAQPSSYRPTATSDPEPLRELAAMLADVRARKKAAQSATAELPAASEAERENESEREIVPTGTGID